MAVVQISKIQVRRGQKSSAGGVIPQLSSAEFAWAVDSQELFIGNGSVAEGAPFVGNTKVLTEHDNILELASSYRFASVDPSITLSMPRSLQNKLDEFVSVVDFGAVGDGSTDCLEAFQNALDQLFRNPDSKFKKTLLVPNGVYRISGNLNIPSTARIRGETQLQSIINIEDNNILFVTEDGLGVAEFDSSNRPVDVYVGNLTINHTSGQFVLTGVADSVIEDVRFLSDYVLGDAVGSIESHPASVFWENSLPGTKVTGITFKGCVFESTPLAVRSDQIIVDISNPPRYDTYVTFDGCKFFIGDSGIVINGIAGQGNKWQLHDCYFEELYRYAFKSTYGFGTTFNRSRFINCGNETNTAADPVYSTVYFGESFGNAVIDCYANRHQSGAITTLNSVDAVSEVYNASKVSLVDQNYADIALSNHYSPLAVFSAFNKYTVINYTLKLGSENNQYTRHGQLTMAIGDDLLGEQDISPVTLSDNYYYSSTTPTSPGGALMTNFEFYAELKDNDGDSGMETILLSYRNPLSSGATGNISYSVAYGV
jgi:hypothetical protein